MRCSMALITAALSILWLLTPPGQVAAGDNHQEMINCNLHQGTCTQRLGGSTVSLAVTPRPVKAMQDLLFRVRLSGKRPPDNKLPFIDLGMPGMNMGPNRVQLKPAGSNSFEGRGVIVRCPSGRRTWQATVTIPDVGQAEFVFDVLY